MNHRPGGVPAMSTFSSHRPMVSRDRSAPISISQPKKKRTKQNGWGRGGRGVHGSAAAAAAAAAAARGNHDQSPPTTRHGGRLIIERQQKNNDRLPSLLPSFRRRLLLLSALRFLPGTTFRIRCSPSSIHL